MFPLFVVPCRLCILYLPLFGSILITSLGVEGRHGLVPNTWLEREDGGRAMGSAFRPPFSCTWQPHRAQESFSFFFCEVPFSYVFGRKGWRFPRWLEKANLDHSGVLASWLWYFEGTECTHLQRAISRLLLNNFPLKSTVQCRLPQE